MAEDNNPLGLNGIEFVEYSAADPSWMHKLFIEFGFSRVMGNSGKKVDYYKQHDIHFLLNTEPGSKAVEFESQHGPCISAMGWRVKDPSAALLEAKNRGARVCEDGDYSFFDGRKVPAIYGIGDSIIYFVKDAGFKYEDIGFKPLGKPDLVPDNGFLLIDHLTNNVAKGEMQVWSKFYRDIFGFTEVRYFDIKGAKTGLTSYALRSPCGKFCIPINEGNEEKSQINEYLREYKGPGVQHIAFLTDDILSSLKGLQGSAIETLDIDDQYYEEVFDRVPNVTEDRKTIKDYQVLVDGDDEGYLLQIFTKNIIGPIFVEIIQRKNHLSFGEGNFGALFRSIERDQEKRGAI